MTIYSGPVAECDRDIFTAPSDRECLGHMRSLAVAKGEAYTVHRSVRSGTLVGYGRSLVTDPSRRWENQQEWLIPVVTILPIPVLTG